MDNTMRVISGILHIYKNGQYVPYFPINTTEDVLVFGEGEQRVSLSTILTDYARLIDISIRSDFNKLYFETLGLHGGVIPLDSTKYSSFEDNNNMVVSSDNVITMLSDTYILI